MKRRTFLGAGAALFVSACAVPPRGGVASTDAAQVPAPQWRTGDSWTYSRTDGFNGLPRGELTRTVESVDGKGLRLVTRSDAGTLIDDALFTAPGIELSGTLSEDGPVKGRFSEPLRVSDFPLAPAKAWQQALVRTDGNGFHTQISLSVRIEGWEDVRAADRLWRALVIRRIFVLGQKNAFSGITRREEVEWYVPEVRGAARIQVTEYMISRRTRSDWAPGDRFLADLARFSAG
jgi:hypothetical protein